MQKYRSTKKTTSAIHSWTASNIMAGSGQGRCKYPTCALLAALTGALHRDWTPAPNPKLLPARGRMQGFMEACWREILNKFTAPSPGRWVLKYFAFSKIERLKWCLQWHICPIIVYKRNESAIALQNKSQTARRTDI